MLHVVRVLLLSAQQLLRAAADARRGRRRVGRHASCRGCSAATLTVTLIFNPFFSALVVRFPVTAIHSDLVPVLHREPAGVLRRAALRGADGRLGGGRLDGARVLRLDDGVRALQHVDLLVLHGRHVQQRAGEAAVRVHRRRRHARLDHAARRSPPRWRRASAREPAAGVGGAARAGASITVIALSPPARRAAQRR